jgi:hypothetical protein
MKNTKQEEKVPPERRSMPCRSMQLHHRRNVHSVPPSIHRSHSLPPRFGELFLIICKSALSENNVIDKEFPSLNTSVCNKWGSEETRKSYNCLCSLDGNTECKRCISSATLNALDRYSLGKMTNPKWRDWWGNFLDLDADATDTTDDE